MIRRSEDGKWGESINFSHTSDIYGGYFSWQNESTIYFHNDYQNGDIFKGKLNDSTLVIIDSLPLINTPEATEFSPFIDPDGRFLIFTRYLEGDLNNQGFFIAHKTGNNWTKPRKIHQLEYGWGANIFNEGKSFIYTDGNDIKSVPLSILNIH